LGALTDNGGPTQTRSITASSQAFNVGTGSCPANDQRGSAFARETGRNCDLGAYGVIRADLAVTKTAPATATLNQAFTYTSSVTNNGPSATQLARITDNLPSGLTFGSATPSQGSCSFGAGQLVCPLGVLANGASANISLVVTPTTGGSISNTATVSPVGRSV